MTEQWKYIVLSDGTDEYPLIFHKKMSHVDVANGVKGESAFSQWSKFLVPLTPVAAGFVYLPDLTVDDWTKSESLKLGPRPQDQALLRKSAHEVFDWLEANADRYDLHGAFSRGTGGIDSPFIIGKLASAIASRQAVVTDEALAIAKDEGKDEGADFVLDALGKALGFEQWTPQDGSETWDGDVHATLMHLLRDAGVLDRETDQRINSALAAPVRDETEIKPTVARYAIALDGWLSCLEGAGTWDAPTLERVRICIGPIIDEMRSNTTVPDQPAEREQMARDWQLTMMKARSFIADNFVTGSFSDRTAAGKLLDQINTILENSFGQRAISQTSKPEAPAGTLTEKMPTTPQHRITPHIYAKPVASPAEGEAVAVRWQRAMTERLHNRNMPDFSLPASEFPDYRTGGGGTLVAPGTAQKCIRQDCDCFDMWHCSRPEIRTASPDREAATREAVIEARDDWQAMMDRASAIRATSNARHAEEIARAEALEQRAHELAKQSGDLGYLS